MHPVAAIRVMGVIAMGMAMGADTLRDLVLVVREDQINAAAVDINRQAQILLDHG